MSKNNNALIITMAGEGSRFVSQGYDKYKPFLELCGQTMLDGALYPFTDFEHIFIITTQKIINSNLVEFKKIDAKIKIIIVEEHKLGPAYSIYLAIENLPKELSYFITYCDVWCFGPAVHFDFFENIESAVFVHRGFHPHLVNDNFSAFCKEDEKRPGFLKEIKEKGSFTNDWMNEPLSIGVFYVRDSDTLFNAIIKIVEDNKKAAGEFYPSLIFNNLIEDKIDVSLIDVKSFTHIGLPTQYEDVKHWHNVAKKLKDNQSTEKYNLTNCMLAGGTGTRMTSVSDTPKHLLMVNNQPMINLVIDSLNCTNNIIIGAPKIDLPDSLVKNCIVQELEYQTSSHLETMSKAITYIEDDKPILFSSCDCFSWLNWEKFEGMVNEYDPDIIIFEFDLSLLNSKLGGQHSTIHSKDSVVIDVDDKGREHEYEKGFAGFFWFKNKSLINTLFEKQEIIDENELIVDDLIKFACTHDYNVMSYNLDHYIHLGTPEEFREFNYWIDRACEMLFPLKEFIND